MDVDFALAAVCNSSCLCRDCYASVTVWMALLHSNRRCLGCGHTWTSMTDCSSSPIDILAIAAHRDDVEQTCGGTLLKHAERGLRTGILDLTRGEMGSRGTADDRAREAAEAAKILRVAWRGALDIPDTRVENLYENRVKVARIVRMLRPRVVILPYWEARHPDHAKASPLGYEACFLAGLKKLDLSPVSPASLSITFQSDSRELNSDQPFRPFKILYASLYADVRPSFVVDI